MQRKAQESWIKDKPCFKLFSKGEQVWLEGTNLKLPANLTSKLSPRRYGPFRVVAVISPVAYQIELPPHWKIHDVFHASLLTCYQETEQHGPNFIEPPPDIIEGEPEWEVEQILKARRFGCKKKLQYFIRWKGYSPSHDSWVDESEMHAPKLISKFYSDHPSAIRTLGIKEPLFLPDDDLSPFQSPLSSVTATPCPSPTREPTSPEQSSLPLELLTELSSFDSIPLTTTSMYSPPSSTVRCLTPSSYGPIFGQTQLLATSILTTRQSQSPLTAERPSAACNRCTLTSFKEIQEQTQRNC